MLARLTLFAFALAMKYVAACIFTFDLFTTLINTISSSLEV